ncbi:hypothetical protein CHU98_g11454 [Xylaria longipes]|nr:hypothetical protein CHU98_g11454 [Xylaria longipes]
MGFSDILDTDPGRAAQLWKTVVAGSSHTRSKSGTEKGTKTPGTTEDVTLSQTSAPPSIPKVSDSDFEEVVNSKCIGITITQEWGMAACS